MTLALKKTTNTKRLVRIFIDCMICVYASTITNTYTCTASKKRKTEHPDTGEGSKSRKLFPAGVGTVTQVSFYTFMRVCNVSSEFSYLYRLYMCLYMQVFCLHCLLTNE